MDDEQIRTALLRTLSGTADRATAHEFYREDAVLEFPQSGERLRGRANIRAMRESYPASVGFSVERISGGGDLWVTEVSVTYDGTTSMRGVSILELRDGQVAREIIYVGEPWDPPAWRARWVEPVG